MGSMSMVIAMTTGRRAESGNNKMSLDLLLSCPGQKDEIGLLSEKYEQESPDDRAPTP